MRYTIGASHMAYSVINSKNTVHQQTARVSRISCNLTSKIATNNQHNELNLVSKLCQQA